MKKLLVAVALALSAVPAFAANGAPYEQNEIDRMLPMLPERTGTQSATVSRERMPFDQVEIDRALPQFAETTERVQLAQLGGGSYTSQAEESTESPWANDHNFIAPPQ
jgi:cytochrome c556